MKLFFYLFIPGIAVIVYYFLYKFKYNILWYFIPFAVSLLTLWIISSSAEFSQTRDKEYWGSVVMEAHYEEPWNEYIHKTCTETYACGTTTSTDSKGHTSTHTKYCTRTYDCSYVDYHSAQYYIKDNLGDRYTISKHDYEWYQNRYGNNPKFVDMHRDYYTQDGDMYVNYWPGTINTHVGYTTKHTYENRVQASHDVFNFMNIDDSDQTTYKLFDYPEPDNNYWSSPILADSNIRINDTALLKLSYMNSLLGNKKQLHFMLLLYNDMPKSSGDIQEQYWKGGNKNEFIVCVGLSKNKVKWCKIISWTENQLLKIKVRDYIEKLDEFNQNKFADFIMPTMEKDFQRKRFRDFSYLQVDVPVWADVLSIILLLIYSIAFPIILIKLED